MSEVLVKALMASVLLCSVAAILSSNITYALVAPTGAFPSGDVLLMGGGLKFIGFILTSMFGGVTGGGRSCGDLLALLKALLYGVCHEIREFLVGLWALVQKLWGPITPDTIQEICGLCKQVATNEYLIALVVTGIAYFIVCEFLFYLEREIDA